MTFDIENRQDIANEQGVADFLEKKWRCKIEKTATFIAYDRVILDEKDNCKALLEIKCRTFEKDRFPDAVFNADKYGKLLQLRGTLGIPVLYVCRWTDQMGVAKVGEFEVLGSKWIRRKTMRQGQTEKIPGDDQLCIRIPTSDFKNV